MKYEEKQELRKLAGLETSGTKRVYQGVTKEIKEVGKIIGFWLAVIACIPHILFCLATGRSIK